MILPLSGICKTDINDSTGVEKYLPYIVRDLQVCDLVKEENNLLKKYNASLIQTATQYNTERNTAIADKETALLHKEKYRRRSIRRGLLFGGHLVLDVLIISLIVL